MNTKRLRNIGLVVFVPAVVLICYGAAVAGQHAKQGTIHARQAAVLASQPIGGCHEFTNLARKPDEQPKLSVEMLRQLYHEPPYGVFWSKRGSSTLAIRIQTDDCTFSDILKHTDPQIPNTRPGPPVP